MDTEVQGLVETTRTCLTCGISKPLTTPYWRDLGYKAKTRRNTCRQCYNDRAKSPDLKENRRLRRKIYYATKLTLSQHSHLSGVVAMFGDRVAQMSRDKPLPKSWRIVAYLERASVYEPPYTLTESEKIAYNATRLYRTNGY